MFTIQVPSTLIPVQLLQVAVGILCAYPLVKYLLSFGRREKLLPPGPPTTFFLGNLLIFPRSQPHLRFTEWGMTFVLSFFVI